MAEAKMYKLMGSDGEFYLSPEKGELGGNEKERRFPVSREEDSHGRKV